MAKLVITLDVHDESFDLSHYPNCRTAVNCVEFDINQVNNGIIDVAELLDAYANKDAVIEIEAKP